MVSTSSTLLLLLSVLTNASLLPLSNAFVQSFIPIIPSRNNNNNKSPLFTPTTTATALRTTISPSSGNVAAAGASLSSVDVVKASSELQNLLLNRWNGESSSKTKEEEEAEINQIETLIQQLVQSRVTFDEEQCLFGPLFATIYTTGTKSKPLWETLSNFATMEGGKRNIQGQRYYKDANGDGKVINYSEVYGRSFHIRADGDCARRITDESQTILQDTPKEEKKEEPTNSQSSPMDSLKSFINRFGGEKQNKNTPLSGSMAKCPIDYVATVQKGSFNLLGKSLDLAIKGTGIARLLYADPNLRIFVSVTENDWEQTAGLEVVQVRINLVDPEWVELS